MGRLNSIQILRFVAALLVVVTHAVPPFMIGQAGVDIFFVISGFIITHVATGRKPWPFMIDRVRRIYPIYFICTVPYVMYCWSSASFGRVMTMLTLWPIYGNYYRPLMPAGWTLSYEMLFYVAVAITLILPRSGRWLLAAFGVAVAANVFTQWPVFQFLGSPLVLEFLAGVALARFNRMRPSYAMAAICAGLAVLVASTPIASWLLSLTVAGQMGRALVWGASATALVAGALGLEGRLRGGIVQSLTYLGGASYSIYLMQGVVLVFAKVVIGNWAAIPTALVVGIGVHRYIEQPLLEFLRKPGPLLRFGRRAPEPQAAE